MEIDPAKVDPKHLKISFLPPKEEMSRRDLIFGLLRPHYEIVPAVEQDRCVAWRGCSVCVASCPQEAISLEGESASIDKDKCTACGACLPACPEEAISSPLLDLEVLDSSLQSLLCRDGSDLAPKVVLIDSEDSGPLLTTVRGSLGLHLLELRLPCIGALSPWLLLRSFDLGADGVAVIPCGPDCRHRCQSERWRWIVSLVQRLLVEFGMEQERLGVFSFSGEEHEALSEFLQAFMAQLKEVSPAILCNGPGRKGKLSLAALLQDLGQRFKVDGSALSGAEIPFGIVRVLPGDKACTLCGACPDRCPTGAITLQEGADSSQLLFDHSRCIACEACVKVCPEQVLVLERALDFSRLGETIALAEDRMAHCQKCGKEIGPLTMLRKIQNQLVGRKNAALSALDRFCPDCRIFISL